jgi:hypothetical protein
MKYVPRYRFPAALQINCDQFRGKLSSKKTGNDYLTVLKPIIIKYLSDPIRENSKQKVRRLKRRMKASIVGLQATFHHLHDIRFRCIYCQYGSFKEAFRRPEGPK